jgi:hypothetical protein
MFACALALGGSTALASGCPQLGGSLYSGKQSLYEPQ